MNAEELKLLRSAATAANSQLAEYARGINLTIKSTKHLLKEIKLFERKNLFISFNKGDILILSLTLVIYPELIKEENGGVLRQYSLPIFLELIGDNNGIKNWVFKANLNSVVIGTQFLKMEGHSAFQFMKKEDSFRLFGVINEACKKLDIIWSNK